MTRRSLAAPLVGTKPWAHGEQSALPTPLAPERCRVHRKPGSRARRPPERPSRIGPEGPPQARLANVTTTRSPLKDEPGWTTHTSKPNFGKGEYFCGEWLTGEWRFV